MISFLVRPWLVRFATYSRAKEAPQPFRGVYQRYGTPTAFSSQILVKVWSRLFWHDCLMFPEISIPIMFFQVASTAIPTLLIAVAVGIKQGATFAGMYERAKTEDWKARMVLITVGLVSIIVLGELAALRAIARGSGNELEALMAWAAIMNCLLLILLEFILPIAYKMRHKGFNRLLQGVSYGVMALAVYVLLIVVGVVPL
jgi:hypothetical protein